MRTRLREVLESGKAAVGLSSVLGNAQIAEVFGHAGFDYIYIDQQHGHTPLDVLLNMLRAIAGTPTTPLVRVPWNDPGAIGQALDAGAEGVIVPMIETAEGARQAVEATRYRPVGSRSWGPIRAHYGLGADPATVNAQVLCLVMIETHTGLENLEDIVRTPGVDGVYIGPADLSVSLGGAPVTFETADPSVREAIYRIRDACNSADKITAISGKPTALAAEGFRMITAGTDMAFIRSGLASVNTSRTQA